MDPNDLGEGGREGGGREGGREGGGREGGRERGKEGREGESLKTNRVTIAHTIYDNFHT